MPDVGKETMVENLKSFAKSQGIKIESSKCEYLTMLDGTEILMYEDYKVLHFLDSKMITIHFDGSPIPVGMKILSDS